MVGQGRVVHFRTKSVLFLLCAAVAGCGDGEGPKSALRPYDGENAWDASGGSAGLSGGGAPDPGTRDAADAPGETSGGSAGQAGSGNDGDATDGDPIVACPPVSSPAEDAGVVCGDGFRDPASEECDDGNADETDLCSSSCRVLARLAAPPGDAQQGDPFPRRLGAGRHVVSARCDGFGVVYVEGGDVPVVSLAAFDRHGLPDGVLRDVSVGSTPLLSAEPVIAGLADDTFVVAWNDFGGDGDLLGIAMKLVDPSRPLLHAPRFANAARAFSQYDPDILRIGAEIVVAWLDDTAIHSGPDVRFRRFDLELAPLTESDETLAASESAESGVSLASFGTSWAAAWRSTGAGGEQIHARSGALEWHVAVGRGGPLDERPGLVEIDASHLLVVFSSEVEGSRTHVLRGAVLDSGRPGSSESFEIQPLVVPDAHVWHNQPALARAGEHVYLSWRSTSALTGPESEEVWLKEITWSADSNGLTLDLSAAEVPLPRRESHRTGTQRAPAVAVAPLWPDGAIAAVWEDYGRVFGAGQSAPDVVVQLIPTPVLRLPDVESRRE